MESFWNGQKAGFRRPYLGLFGGYGNALVNEIYSELIAAGKTNAQAHALIDSSYLFSRYGLGVSDSPLILPELIQGANATLPVGTSKPTIIANGLRFDGVDDYFDFSFPSEITGFTLVLDIDSTSGQAIFSSTDSTNNGLFLNGLTTLLANEVFTIGKYGAYSADTTNPSYSGLVCIQGFYAGSAWRVWLNSSELTLTFSGGGAGKLTNTGLRFGQRVSTGNIHASFDFKQMSLYPDGASVDAGTLSAEYQALQNLGII